MGRISQKTQSVPVIKIGKHERVYLRSVGFSMYYFFPIITKIGVHLQNEIKFMNTKFHQNPSGGIRAFSSGQMYRCTETHNETCRRF
jgi:hypothetical protein